MLVKLVLTVRHVAQNIYYVVPLSEAYISASKENLMRVLLKVKSDNLSSSSRIDEALDGCVKNTFKRELNYRHLCGSKIKSTLVKFVVWIVSDGSTIKFL